MESSKHEGGYIKKQICSERWDSGLVHIESPKDDVWGGGGLLFLYRAMGQQSGSYGIAQTRGRGGEGGGEGGDLYIYLFRAMGQQSGSYGIAQSRGGYFFLTSLGFDPVRVLV